jgi:predicted lipoprotein
VREALTKRDQSVTEAASLAGKSVALQGLPALEYLLHGDGATTLTKSSDEAQFSCRFSRRQAGDRAGAYGDANRA